MDSSFLQDRIDAMKLIIVAYEDAIIFLTSNPTESYSLDTGQTITRVTRHNIADLQRGLDSSMNSLSTYEARLNGSGTGIARPLY